MLVRSVGVALMCGLMACHHDGRTEPKQDASGGPQDAEVVEDGAATDDDDSGPSGDADAGGPVDNMDAAAPLAAWTVLVYMAADNNLEKAAIDDLTEMLGVGASEAVNVIVQIDRTVGFYDLGVGNVSNWDTMKRFRVSGGKLEELMDLGELDTGASETLSSFLEWGLRTYPAQRRALVLWDHGNAWRGYGGDDTSDKDLLDQLEIGQSVAEGIERAGLPTVDLIGFDACLMSSASTARLVSRFTRYMLASEELVPGNGWDYRAVLQQLIDHPESDVPTFAGKIIDSFYAQSRQAGTAYDVTCNLLDLSKMSEFDSALAALLDKVEGNLELHARDVADAQTHALEYGHHADPTLSHHMRDLGDFATKLAAEEVEYAPLSQRLTAALKALVVASVYGRNKQASTGLSAYFPPHRVYYDAHYDAVPEAVRWRQFLNRFYSAAEAVTVEPPAFEDSHEHQPIGAGELPALGTGGCDPAEGPFVVAQLSGEDAAQVVHASLIAGFVESSTGEVHVFAREPARVDTVKKQIKGTWDRHLFTAEQGAHIVPLFAEITLEPTGRYAYAEIPLVYSEPTPCACAHTGEPGYSDVDDDQMPDCADDDVDADGVPDKAQQKRPLDNCPWKSNPKQEDADGDGVGDACEANSGAPNLGCTPAPSGDYGAFLPAVWHVAIDRHDRRDEADTLYVMDTHGTAELTPEVGGVLWPRRLMVRRDGTTAFRTEPPLPFNLHQKISFDYADSEQHHLQNAAGDPVLDANLKPVSLLETLGLSHVYLHLELDDVTGRGDVATVILDGSTCDPPKLDICPGNEEPDCDGTCIEPSQLAPNGVCDDGSKGGPDLFCELLNFDDGECIRPACRGGYVRDCHGRCTLPAAILGDGKCDELAACRALGWDEDDCVCGSDCSGHGTCTTLGCSCTDGFSGPYCDRPPSCGDGVCDGARGETCVTCNGDCGACAAPCGDGVCRRGNGETCATCGADCGACRCGDGACTSGVEDCQSCEADCGTCPICGDFVCALLDLSAGISKAREEHCASCATDCGACRGDCCAAAGMLGDAASRVGCGEPAIARCVCAVEPECCNSAWTAGCAERAVRECGLTCENCSDAEGADVDADLVCGGIDNCPTLPNPRQEDADGDDVGDACDTCAGDDRQDADGDGLPDACDLCPHHADNPQQDGDRDGIGDACDPCRGIPNADRSPRACIDADGDAVADAIDDCPGVKNPDQLDMDRDGRGDACDNCVRLANADQKNTDMAGDGDACACPNVAELCQNFLDDDCDGAIDEGCSCSGVPEICNGADDDCDGSIDEGCPACRAAAEICGDGIDQDCDGKPDDGCSCTPTPEICVNALDDDCDRHVDEPPCIEL